MKAILILVVFCAFAYGVRDLEYEQFQNWLTVHEKKYSTIDEHAYRFKVFKSNLKKIAELNAENSGATFGPTVMADLTEAEFEERYLSLRIPARQDNVVSKISNVGFADVDWTSRITGVRDQRSCGSCWAFSAVAAIEAAYIIFKGAPTSLDLSEQQLVDCSWDEGNQGCNGGWMDYAFDYTKTNGLTTESAFPYTGYDGTCKVDSGIYKIASYTDLPVGDGNALGTALNKQPISVAVAAGSYWSYYTGGIMANTRCSNNLDHGVLLIGVSASGGYWKIKNSWGTGWGESGYIRLAYSSSSSGACTTMLTQAASYPSP